MARYYVNKNAQSNGDHEVHKQGCTWMPHEDNRIYLGNFSNGVMLLLQLSKASSFTHSKK